MADAGHLIEKARTAASVPELLELAKVHGIDISEEQAQEIFLRLNRNSGEISDDDLSDVAGGGCSANVNGQNRTVVSSGCPCFTGGYACGVLRHTEDGSYLPMKHDNYDLRKLWLGMAWLRFTDQVCGACFYLEFKNGIGYCGFNKEA